MPSALPVGDPAPADGCLPPFALEGAEDRALALYVHVPFCATRCGYCDFNTYTAQELGSASSTDAYLLAARSELELAANVLGTSRKLSTVFFGGGTPTLLPPSELAGLLDAVAARFALAPAVEVTTEANPETVTPEYLDVLRAAGFTRISLGMQSARPHVLRLLERTHTPGKALECVELARAAGFEHVSLDLIYGTPGESEQDWQDSLDAVVSTQVDHVSAYALVVEDGTAMARKVASGVLEAPQDDVLAERYVMADETLAAAGFGWYEVSNWAKGDAGRCRHNELYWRNADWWGIGPGAHSHVGGVRWWNVKHPAAYSTALGQGHSPAAGREVLDATARRLEQVLLETRLVEGMAVDDAMDARALGQLASEGLIEPAALADAQVVLTLTGRLLADRVVRELT